MSRKKVIAPFAILAAGMLAVAIVMATRPRVKPSAPEVPAPLVRVARVEPRDMQLIVRAHGSVVPRSESDLVAQVAGEVQWVSPALVAGGFFEAEEPLVRIERSDYESELAAARAGVARADSELARARTERKRQRSLADRSVVSQSRIDDVENAYRVAEAHVHEANARLQRAERDLERTELRAPYAGRVREESVDVGEYVSRGSTLARLYAVDYAEVRLPIPDRELRFVDLPLAYRPGTGGSAEAFPPDGPVVRLHAEFAGRDHVWTGRIVRTEGELDPKSRMVHVVARIEDPYGRLDSQAGTPLAVGMFVEAEILGHQIADAVVLPRAALHPMPEGAAVLVLTDDQRLRFRPVEVIRSERERVVIGAGLSAGERVCVSPLRAAVDGMAVRVLEARDAPEDAASPAAGSVLSRSSP